MNSRNSRDFAARPQSVADADRDIRLFLIRIAAVMGEVLGARLIGVYVYGSLAQGSYRRDHSDIDVLAVVAATLDPTLRASLARALLALSDGRPTPGDIEVTVITEKTARTFEYPTPYEVQYSSAWHDAIRDRLIDFGAQRIDRDLATGLMDVRSRGARLIGPEPATLFGPIPWYAFINSVEHDFDWAGEHVAEQPVYAVLSACRALHATTHRSIDVVSKEEAGRWARAQVPSGLRPLIDEALEVRAGLMPTISAQRAARIGALRTHVLDYAQNAFERARDDDEEPVEEAIDQ